MKAEEIAFTFSKWSDPNGWNTKSLWSYTIQMSNGFVPFEVYDAAYDLKDDALITVFRQGGTLRANVIRGDAQAGRKAMDWSNTEMKPSRVDAKLTSPSPSSFSSG